MRETNVFDEGVSLHTVSAAQNMAISATATPPTVSAGTAEWSKSLNVRGYDRLTLFIDHTVGTTETNLYIDIESSMSKNGPWFRRASSFDLLMGDATTVALSDRLNIDTSAMSGADRFYYAVEVETTGCFMRFFPWIKGSNAAGSRLRLDVNRRMIGQ